MGKGVACDYHLKPRKVGMGRIQPNRCPTRLFEVLHRVFGMRRRTVLTSTGTFLSAILTGCTGFGPSNGVLGVAEDATARLEMTALTDAALPPKVLYGVGVEGDSDHRVKLFERILDGGTTTEGTRPPFPKDQHIFYDDAVYQLSYDVVEQTPATNYQIRVDVVQGTVNESEAIQFSELPAIDREKFAARRWDDGGTFGLGTSILYTHAEHDKSVLVPDSKYSYIVWKDGSEAAWFVDDSNETPLNTYEYTVSQVAPAAEYGRQMRERFAFALSDLSNAQRDIVETTISKEQYVINPDEGPLSALVALADRFRDQEQVHGLDEPGEDDLSGTYLVRYNDEIYWTTLVVHGDAFATETSE